MGVKKGDRVIIYIPMTIEGVIAMQACARIGATHSVVFGGFSAKSLQERIIDAGAVAIITADEQMRGGGWGLFHGCAAGDTAMALVIKVG
jgi:acetyl-CoA synthetase